MLTRQSRGSPLDAEPSRCPADDRPVGCEVVAIEREDSSGPQRLRRYDQGRIGEIHRMIRIATHELERSFQRPLTEKPHPQAPRAHEALHRTGACARGPEQVKYFGQNRHRRHERTSQRLEDPLRARVGIVAGIEQSDERTRVDENHADRFRRRSWRIAALARRAGAFAYPPGPRSRLR